MSATMKAAVRPGQDYEENLEHRLRAGQSIVRCLAEFDLESKK